MFPATGFRMSVLYDQVIDGVHYRVTAAGAARRLYTDGIFHTAYHPKKLFTGSVWDMLSVPALFAEAPPQNALMLGVGGGGAIHQCFKLFPLQQLIGIEIDPVHLRLAEQYFELRYPELKLQRADALRWLKQRRKQRFDLIIDDVFIASEHPVRPLKVDAHWLDLLCQHLSPDGVLIQNHASLADARQVLNEHHIALNRAFASILIFVPENAGNAVIAAFRKPTRARNRRAIEQRLRTQLGSSAIKRLRYHVRTV